MNEVLFKYNGKKITKRGFIQTLKKLGLKKGDDVFVHSGLGKIGKIGDIKNSEKFANLIIDCFLEVISPGTLMVPTYSYSFCRKKDYDQKTSKSDVGILTNFFFKRSDSIRSDHPIHSVAAIGEKAKYYTEIKKNSSFGEKSFFEKLVKNNVKNVGLGVPLVEAMTLLHHIEQINDVPYRFNKNFNGKIIKGNKKKKASFDFFVRYLDLTPNINHRKIEKFLLEKKVMKSLKLGNSVIEIAPSVKTVEILTKQLKKDPFWMVKMNGVKTNYPNIGKEMHALIEKLYPICRSITGDGVRETLQIIKRMIPIDIKEVPTGTKVFDWSVPKEWNIKDAYIKNSKGEKIVDFKKSNLHVLNYSIPINKKMSLNELKKHLFTIPDYPNWIPYRTSYYKENWGFCLTHNQFKKLKEDTYQVVIDSSLKKGNLTLGELYIKGKRKDEVLISTYFCHPSLCNDNLSGVVLSTFLALLLLHKENLNYSYRFLFIPETIGSITWLSQNEKKLSNIKHGLVVTCVGDSGHLTYKKSRDGNALIDKIVEKVLIDSGDEFEIKDFFPFGSDERQYCSPGFNLSVGSLMRTQYFEFPEYHTSADNLDFIKAEYLGDSLEKYANIIEIIESDKTYVNTNPKCEPQLGRRGLYKMIGGKESQDINKYAMLWVLNLSDGTNSLLDISIRSGIKFEEIKKAADALYSKKLFAVK